MMKFFRLRTLLYHSNIVIVIITVILIVILIFIIPFLFSIVGLNILLIGILASIILTPLTLYVYYLQNRNKPHFQYIYKVLKGSNPYSFEYVKNLENDLGMLFFNKDITYMKGQFDNILKEFKQRDLLEALEYSGKPELIKLNKIQNENSEALIYINGFLSVFPKTNKIYELLKNNLSYKDIYVLNWDNFSFLGIFSFLNWKKAKIHAWLSSHIFSELITENNLSNIILIGHSLGCRLIYETMKYSSVSNRIKEIWFFGAAISDDSNFHIIPKNILFNFFSFKDLVLKYAFRYAEKLFVDSNLSRQAIGYVGMKSNGWNIDCTSFIKGHSKYFNKIENFKQCIKTKSHINNLI